MKNKIRIIVLTAAAALKAIQIGTAAFVGYKAYINVFAPLASAERGYTGAAGGEIIAAIIAAMAVYFIIGRIIDLMLECLAEYISHLKAEAIKKRTSSQR